MSLTEFRTWFCPNSQCVVQIWIDNFEWPKLTSIICVICEKRILSIPNTRSKDQNENSSQDKSGQVVNTSLGPNLYTPVTQGATPITLDKANSETCQSNLWSPFHPNGSIPQQRSWEDVREWTWSSSCLWSNEDKRKHGNHDSEASSS